MHCLPNGWSWVRFPVWEGIFRHTFVARTGDSELLTAEAIQIYFHCLIFSVRAKLGWQIRHVSQTNKIKLFTFRASGSKPSDETGTGTGDNACVDTDTLHLACAVFAGIVNVYFYTTYSSVPGGDSGLIKSYIYWMYNRIMLDYWFRIKNSFTIFISIWKVKWDTLLMFKLFIIT